MLRLLHLRIAIVAASAIAVLPAQGRADDVPVPIRLQADVLFMVAGHDRNLMNRAGGHVRTLVLTKPGADSTRAAAQFRIAADARPVVGGLPHTVEVAQFTSPAALAEACRVRRLSVVYLTPGFSETEVATIGEALEGADVLTVSAVPRMVTKGVVLGFDLVSGRAKLLVDRSRAGKQRVAFGPEVLGLMTVLR
jgi:YfiR/HmsC-like